jgi:glycosyltransferase involved in cell wall biosynthesis
MRIGIDLLSCSRESEGVRTYVQRLLQGLRDQLRTNAEKDHQIVVFAPQDFPPLLKTDTDSHITQIQTPARPRLRLSLRSPLTELLDRYPVDLVHVVDPSGFPSPPRIPHVVTVPDLSGMIGGSGGWIGRTCRRQALQRSLNSARKVITLSSATRETVLRNLRGLDASRVAVIHEGTDPEFCASRNPTEESQLREKYGLPSSFILTVTLTDGRSVRRRIVRVAQHLEVLRARSDEPVSWVMMSLSRKGVRGWKRLLRKNGVQSVSPIAGLKSTDLPHLLKMASSFVYADSKGPGFPLIGALASGTPVITSDALSPGELVEKAAIRVDMNNPVRVAECLDRVLRNRTVRDLLRMRGPARARTFSWEIAARKTLEIYEEATV